jgi:hypothetical protein
MERTSRILFILIVWLSVLSCHESPHVDFHSYQELAEYNFIGNGWIPEILGKDAVGIQETYDVNNTHLFGKFDFKFRLTYDSIIKKYQPVTQDSLLEQIKKIKMPRYPAWFIQKNDLKKENFVLAKNKEFYIIMEKKTNRIYYLR